MLAQLAQELLARDGPLRLIDQLAVKGEIGGLCLLAQQLPLPGIERAERQSDVHRHRARRGQAQGAGDELIEHLVGEDEAVGRGTAFPGSYSRVAAIRSNSPFTVGASSGKRAA